MVGGGAGKHWVGQHSASPEVVGMQGYGSSIMIPVWSTNGSAPEGANPEAANPNSKRYVVS
jgi:hypothetical protein